MSRVIGNKRFAGADQLRGNLKVDQRLCFRFIASTVPLLPRFQVSSYLKWLCSPVCVRR